VYLIKAFPLSSKFFHSSNDEQAGENKIFAFFILFSLIFLCEKEKDNFTASDKFLTIVQSK